jgi:signal transduction histidine kinase
MGLWIAKGLVGAAHGRVWAENCADGGAQFTIALPLVASPAGDESAVP